MEAIKYILKDVLSCVLSYALCQPVEIDVALFLYLMVEYTGLLSVYKCCVHIPSLIQGLMIRKEQGETSFMETDGSVTMQHAWTE
jgi:hypothetical protein